MIECPLCKSRRIYKSWEDGNYKIYKCTNCYVKFLYPIVKVENLYDSSYFQKWYIEFYQERKKYFKKILKKIKKLIPSKGKILDVGCGIGILLDLASEIGYEVYGQDISDFAIEFCSQKGFKVFKGNLSNLNFEIKFDIITMMDVIAHIKEPVNYLQKCKKLLEKDGILIIKTPLHSNYLFFIAKLFSFTKKSKSILHLPVQIYHFDKNSISKLAYFSGFKILKILTIKEFTGKKFNLLNLWKFFVEKSIIVILKKYDE
ncbi:MAG: methyltransferase domain-containing protein [Candidatus Omnitrophica bacterium]|nr:methyltransferase domain-containing protein [Candidatus Omnitrophota bacterium]